MAAAMDVVRYLVELAGPNEEGEPMTHMRLQKLLYYVQGWHMAWYGRPLFAERIEAWQHGPVVLWCTAKSARTAGSRSTTSARLRG